MMAGNKRKKVRLVFIINQIVYSPQFITARTDKKALSPHDCLYIHPHVDDTHTTSHTQHQGLSANDIQTRLHNGEHQHYKITPRNKRTGWKPRMCSLSTNFFWLND